MAAHYLSVLALLAFLAPAALAAPGDDGAPAKQVLGAGQLSENLIKADAWRPYEQGFERADGAFLCENGPDASVRRGAAQSVVLDQTTPLPIVARAWSRAEGVGGSADTSYSLYLDLTYTDGTPLWGQTADFRTGTHDWERGEVVVLPEKPVRSVSVYVLLRGHAGRAWFRDVELRQARPDAGAVMFDGLAVVPRGPAVEGFQVRDVAAGGDFVHIRHGALGLRLDAQQAGAFTDVTLTDTTGGDRAVTLLYCVPVAPEGLRWLEDARRSEPVEPGREYMRFSRFAAGANGRLSKYPFAAVAGPGGGTALGIDLAYPAFYRVGYNAASGELFLAYDLGLTPERPSARLRLCRFGFEPRWGFRAALERYYSLLPDEFRCRTPEQGLWMPFAPISKVEGWQDFGFKFKEGDGETAWDDAHGILTFRYTEPMTWWMPMAKDAPRTLDGALAVARRMAADEKGDRRARALLTSGFHDESGHFVARLLSTPWNDGAVWSMNSMPGIQGEYTDFNLKWSAAVRERLYGPSRKGDLDGEYVDSSEGYVTDQLDFRRDHFAAADTPLTFSPRTHRPAIFRGLVAFEYVRAIARDVHAMDRLMMANGTPGGLPWLAPMLDVCGTETDWDPGGTLAPHDRPRDALPPLALPRQAILLPDEHGLRQAFAGEGGEVHEAQPRLRHVPRILQPQRQPGRLLHPARTLQPRPAALPQVRAALQGGGRGRLGARHERGEQRPARLRRALRGAAGPLPSHRLQRQPRAPYGRAEAGPVSGRRRRDRDAGACPPRHAPLARRPHERYPRRRGRRRHRTEVTEAAASQSNTWSRLSITLRNASAYMPISSRPFGGFTSKT